MGRKNDMPELDRLIHEPVRLRIMSVLTQVDKADFNFMLTALGVTKGNLSCHMDRLEQAGYINVTKGFNGKIPHTAYQPTRKGRAALKAYWKHLDEIRAGLGHV
jgi:DNA-binding MarR family transcriptional regulator